MTLSHRDDSPAADESPLDGWLATAASIAAGAGAVAMGLYRADPDVQMKQGDSRNLVTEADLAAEAHIKEALHKHFPDHAILSEESYSPGDTIDDQIPTWLVDPIDGTSNFAHGSPFFCVSMGLYHAGRPLLGVIDAPALGYRFTVARGRGAFVHSAVGQERIDGSQKQKLEEAIVACDWARQPELRQLALASHSALAARAHTMRSLGSAALGLAAVAAGWVDLYFNYSLYPWDTAVGALLVQEAGGRCTRLSGAPWTVTERDVLASNGHIHPAALRALASNLPPA